jgi:hypothetical protein
VPIIGCESQRDDIAGEQRVDEPAGTALPAMGTTLREIAMVLGDAPQDSFLRCCQ